jgi:hypothetical protein
VPMRGASCRFVMHGLATPQLRCGKCFQNFEGDIQIKKFRMGVCWENLGSVENCVTKLQYSAGVRYGPQIDLMGSKDFLCKCMEFHCLNEMSVSTPETKVTVCSEYSFSRTFTEIGCSVTLLGSERKKVLCQGTQQYLFIFNNENTNCVI